MAYRSFSLIPSLNNHLLSDRFNQIDNLFSRLTGETPVVDAPSYNLLQKNKDHYEITVSVPGYNQDELDILVLNNKLTVSGKPKSEELDSYEEKEGMKCLHKGIKKSSFSLSFSLEHRITIQYANLDKGLLRLDFTYDIPEQEKPQKVTIGMQSKSCSALEHHSS